VDDAGGGDGVRARLAAVLLPAIPDEVFTTATALRYGATQRQLEWAVRTGRLHRLRRGVFCGAQTWAGASPEERLVLYARAVHCSRPGVVFSHVTAAALLGLPVPPSAGPAIWVTGPPGTRTGAERGVVHQSAPLAESDLTEVGGLLCTSPARTVADCLRHLDALAAVPIGDAALRARLVTGPELEQEVAGRRWPRAQAASGLLPLLDGRRESPLESRSAVVMHRYGIPPPAVQVRILDEQGRFVGRADTLWLEQGVVGEADGLVKYDGGAPVVSDERARQTKFQALGLVVVRWTERQLHGDPPPMVQALGPALEAGGPGRFRGRIA
jgi:hypothetical protein